MVLFYRYTEIFSVQYFKSIVQSLSQYKYEIPGVALTMRVWSSSKLLKKKKALHDVVDQELAFSLLNASWSLAYALKHCILPNEIRNWLCQEQQVQHGTRGCGGVCFTFYLLGKLQLQRGSSKDEWDWIENHVSF